MKFFNAISLPLALGLMCVSIYFSVGLLSHFSTTTTEYYVYSFAAILFQLSMNILWIIGHYHSKSGNPIQAVFSFVGWALLLTISLAGTMGAFSVSTSRNEIILASGKVRHIKDEIKKKDESIKYYQGELRYGVRNRLITTVVRPTQAILKKLEEERRDLTEELERIADSPPPDEFFESLAGFIGFMNASGVKMWLFFFVAVAVDLTQFTLLKYAFDAGLMGKPGKDKMKGVS